MTRQDNRITLMDKQLNEDEDENLNDIFALTGQKLAVKLSVLINGDALIDHVLTDIGENSTNSSSIPWKPAEIIAKKFPSNKAAVNA